MHNDIVLDETGLLHTSYKQVSMSLQVVTVHVVQQQFPCSAQYWHHWFQYPFCYLSFIGHAVRTVPSMLKVYHMIITLYLFNYYFGWSVQFLCLIIREYNDQLVWPQIFKSQFTQKQILLSLVFLCQEGKISEQNGLCHSSQLEKQTNRRAKRQTNNKVIDISTV